MRPGWRGTLTSLLVLVILFAAWLACLAWSRGEKRRALEELAPAERRIAFQGSLESFKRLCVERRDAALETYCQDQAELIEVFPECDAPCREILAKSRPPHAVTWRLQRYGLDP